MKNTWFLNFLLISTLVYGQVGINTIDPKSTLDITSSDQASPASNDGLLIPKADEFPAINPTADQDGMLLYITGIGSAAKGFYFWNNDIPEWVNFTAGHKQIGREMLRTTDGTFTVSGGNFIWDSSNASSPSFETSSTILAPFGGTDSHITVIPSTTSGTRDTFVCDRNITSLRVFTTIQLSSSSNGRWRTFLYTDGAFVNGYWGSPPSNRSNQRTQGAFEYGPIAAGVEISIAIDDSQLPASTQNQRTYFIIEYEN